MKKAAVLGFAAVMILTFTACKLSPPINTQNDPPPYAEEELKDLIPMVQVNGVIYYDTGMESDFDIRCGTYDGEITSSVDSTQTPTANNQSNFGTGYGYQLGKPGTIEVLIDRKWIVFAAEEPEPICSYPTCQEMQENTPPS